MTPGPRRRQIQGVILPPPLLAGATIAVVAPSGPFDAEQLRSGLARLNEFQIRVPDGLWERRLGFLAGTDRDRRDELQSALEDDDVAAIWIARGGYGLGRIIDSIDLSPLERRHKWIVGFSDATVLHARLWQLGYVSLHAPNGTTLAQVNEQDLEALRASLQHQPPADATLRALVGGEAAGPLVGGNLTVLFSEAAAGRLKLPEGSVLFLEDVTETSYRVDRMLGALRAGGYFSKCSGLVFGDFTDCSPGKFHVPVEAVIERFADELGLPCASGLPAGHGRQNLPLVLGKNVRLSVPGRPHGAAARLAFT